MNELIRNNLQGRKIIIFLILTNFIYLLMLRVTIPMVMSFTAGMKIPDLMPAGYDPQYIAKLLNELGERGRQVYLYRQIPLDMIYPLLFAITYSLVLGYILNKLGKLANPYSYLCLLPVMAGFFDYLENIGIITLLATYPDPATGLCRMTSLFTVFKSLFTTFYFLILILFIFFYFIRRKKRIHS